MIYVLGAIHSAAPLCAICRERTAAYLSSASWYAPDGSLHEVEIHTCLTCNDGKGPEADRPRARRTLVFDRIEKQLRRSHRI